MSILKVKGTFESLPCRICKSGLLGSGICSAMTNSRHSVDIETFDLKVKAK